MNNIAQQHGFGSDAYEPSVGSSEGGEGGGLADSSFHQRIDSIKDRLDRVSAEVENLRVVQSQISRAVRNDDIEKIDKQIEDKTQEIRNICNGCKKDLDVIKQENDQIKMNQGDIPALHVRVDLYNMAINKFSKTLEILNSNQSDYQVNLKRLCKNRLTKVNCVEDEEADEIIENYNPRLSDLLQSGTADVVINRLESRRDAALQLEKSIRELYDMFNELAVLIQGQQTYFDSIEQKANSSQQAVAAGVDELNKAKKSQVKSRKCLCCIIIVGIVALCAICVIVFPVVFTQMSKKA